MLAGQIGRIWFVGLPLGRHSGIIGHIFVPIADAIPVDVQFVSTNAVGAYAIRCLLTGGQRTSFGKYMQVRF